MVFVPDIIYGTRVIVNIQPSGTGASTNAFSFEARVRELRETGGARPSEEIKTLGNNEIERRMPQEPKEVELAVISTDTRLWEAVAGGSDAAYKYGVGNVGAGSSPIIVAGDQERLLNRVWLEASGTTADSWHIRKIWKNALGVSFDSNVTAEGFMEENITFRCAAQDFTNEWTGSFTSKPLSTLPSF